MYVSVCIYIFVYYMYVYHVYWVRACVRVCEREKKNVKTNYPSDRNYHVTVFELI